MNQTISQSRESNFCVYQRHEDSSFEHERVRVFGGNLTQKPRRSLTFIGKSLYSTLFYIPNLIPMVLIKVIVL